MAFSSNNAIDFSSSTGYTFDAAEFVISGGVGTLDTGETGPTTCTTPSIDTSTWTFINRVEISDEVEGTYRHKYLISFDGGSTWRRYRQGLWGEVALTSIETTGMTRWQVEAIRDWSLLDDSLSFAVSASRTDTGDAGEVSGFTVYYLTGSTEEQVTVPGTEPYEKPTETVEADIGIQPDLPLTLQFIWPSDIVSMTGNYQVCVRRSETYRLMLDVSWSGLTETQRDTLLAFIADHYETPFIWEQAPLHETDELAFLFCQEPSTTQMGPDVWRVSTRIIQAFYESVTMSHDFVEYGEGTFDDLEGGVGWDGGWRIEDL
jgi:hypothetical protein